MNAWKGFSLLELLLALAIISIVAVLAAPRFGELTARATPTIESERLLASVWAARHAAITQGQPVTIKAKGGDWNTGWIVFVDENHNAIREPSEPVLQVAEPIQQGYQITANSGIGVALSYLPHGESRRPGGSLQMGTFTLCKANESEGLQPMHAVIISATGRPRTLKGSSLSGGLCPNH